MTGTRAGLRASQRKGFLHAVKAGDLYKPCHQGAQQFLAQKDAVIPTFAMSNILKAVQP